MTAIHRAANVLQLGILAICIAVVLTCANDAYRVWGTHPDPVAEAN